MLFGHPGLGKTTFAEMIAIKMNKKIKIVTGSSITKIGDLVSLLSSLSKGDILFIDEIHRLSIVIEEVLYGAMEQFKINIVIGKGMAAKNIDIPVSPFTLIGATTQLSFLSAPLLSRFGIIEKFDWYSLDDMKKVIFLYAEIYSLILSSEVVDYLASAARGTPRTAKKLVAKVRDYACANDLKVISADVFDDIARFLNIYPGGFWGIDIKILSFLYERKSPVGLFTIASAIGEEVNTLELVYEPYLIYRRLIEKTPRGRVIPDVSLEKVKFILDQVCLFSTN